MSQRQLVSRDWSRQYPPLAVMACAIVLAVFTLPSALTLPQASPTQTLEYAPVPPNNTQAPPGGNLSSLGLATSSTIGSALVGGALGSPGGTGGSPSNKQCVGSPPRQDEDPLSPPCVAFFNGDNGGSTYQGVTRAEITVVMYVTAEECTCPGCANVGSRGVICHPVGETIDANSQPQAGDDYWMDAARIWERYFNLRYQTYNRVVHVWVRFPSEDAAGHVTDTTERADAADVLQKLHPFATTAEGLNGAISAAPFIETMAAHGVLNFGSTVDTHASEFTTYPKLIWGFWPSLELHAHQFSNYLCEKVVPNPVSVGQVLPGQPRRLGFLYTSSPGYPEDTAFAQLVMQQVRACGGNIVDAQQFACANVNSYCDSPEQGEQRMASFQRNNVTTVIWAEAEESVDTNDAASLNYYPEWILAGDANLEDIVNPKYQNTREMMNAWVVSLRTLQHGFDHELCVTDARDVDPSLPSTDLAIPCAAYADFRQLFTGIQVAGPRLTPDSVDAGFHAIPGHPSSNPSEPACYYLPGDYTCVKDGIVMWYDPNASSPYSGAPGCWRVTQGGRRYLIEGSWPPGNIEAQRNPAADPCNSYTTGAYTDPSPGSESPTPQ